ncbi:hypothetical protein Ddc_14944 [Ditylenchus destructor]|nr:hypothetical protein Ddc_14944 [Ditylenchus destructor]
MSLSKPVPPYLFDSLYYLNRDQLERFSIVCRDLNNFIKRYFNSKPYRIFDQLLIRGGRYALRHQDVHWHPNRDDYDIQQFLANQKCIVDENRRKNVPSFMYYRAYSYSFDDMRRYLSPTVRIRCFEIHVAGDTTYNPEQIAELESLAYLWRDGSIWIENDSTNMIRAEDIPLILNSPTILQCRQLHMTYAHFSFKNYQILYTVKVFKILYPYEDDYGDDDIDSNYWPEFLDQPGAKPVVVLNHFPPTKVVDMLDRLSKAFHSAISPNAFKVVIEYEFEGQITEFRETNNISREKLELKAEIPLECQEVIFDYDYYCTLERSSI